MKKLYRSKNILFGVGFDCKDKHMRITKGKNFYLYGGSHRTHKALQEKAIKFNEQLDKRGKTLDTICKREFNEITHKIGLGPIAWE